MSPDFNASPNKRRRYEDDAEAEAAQRRGVPRVHRGPRHRIPLSPRQSPSAPRSSDRWVPAPETTVSPGSSYSLPTPMEVQDLSRPRIPLPSLRTTMNFENESQNSLESSQSSSRDYPRAYSQDYTHYNTHSHYQSQPSSPGRPYDRTPFSAGVYHTPHYMETNHTNHYGELGSMAGESKQRKRRGNLPKETTDKLRNWFIAHLQHPYPTEDEKQELVRQTGLQMNQISNWFINARRRQLPAMLKHERGEGDATGRGITSREGKSTDPSSIASSPISEAEAHSSDEILQRHRRGSLKRGSV
ncbi:homeobox KN domain-containing protein [Trichoderma velutinum]